MGGRGVRGMLSITEEGDEMHMAMVNPIATIMDKYKTRQGRPCGYHTLH